MREKFDSSYDVYFVWTVINVLSQVKLVGFTLLFDERGIMDDDASPRDRESSTHLESSHTRKTYGQAGLSS